MSHLVDEGGEPVVEGLDLLPLLSPDSLDGGVDLQVEGSQETLVDGDLLDASRGTDGHARAPIATSKARSTTEPKATTSSTAKTKSTPGSTSKAIAASSTGGTNSVPEATAATANGDPLGAPQVVEAPAAIATRAVSTPRADPAKAATSTPGPGHRGETGAGDRRGDGRGGAEATAAPAPEGHARLARHDGLFPVERE